MVSDTSSRIPELVKNNENEILARWVERLLASPSHRPGLLPEHELRRDAAEFLEALRYAVQTGNFRDIDGPDWARVRDVLAALSRSRARQDRAVSEGVTKATLADAFRLALQKTGQTVSLIPAGS